jgi:hypothetical protein
LCVCICACVFVRVCVCMCVRLCETCVKINPSSIGIIDLYFTCVKCDSY